MIGLGTESSLGLWGGSGDAGGLGLGSGGVASGDDGGLGLGRGGDVSSGDGDGLGLGLDEGVTSDHGEFLQQSPIYLWYLVRTSWDSFCADSRSLRSLQI